MVEYIREVNGLWNLNIFTGSRELDGLWHSDLLTDIRELDGLWHLDLLTDIRELDGQVLCYMTKTQYSGTVNGHAGFLRVYGVGKKRHRSRDPDWWKAYI